MLTALALIDEVVMDMLVLMLFELVLIPAELVLMPAELVLMAAL